MDRKITKKYTNGEVTVVWQPEKCIHSAICFTGLPKVFNPRERPWVTPEGGTTEQIVNQVKKCPSGALSFYMNDERDKEAAHLEANIEALPNGPLLVYGTLHIKTKTGEQILENKTTALCRCGQSNNKPFCDGSHLRVNFQD
jgi:uncharacterized Fe-S cluster protein YjdI